MKVVIGVYCKKQHELGAQHFLLDVWKWNYAA